MPRGHLGDPRYVCSCPPPLVERYRDRVLRTPALRLLERRFGSPVAIALYCSFDPGLYRPEEMELRWDLGYMGTYSDDRQPSLERLLIEPTRRGTQGRFSVARPQYPRRSASRRT